MSSKPSWGRFGAEFRAARTPAGRARFGRVALEGIRVCERAARAGAAVEQVLVVEGFDRGDPRRAALVDGLRDAGARIDRAPEDVLSELCEGRDLGGIVALAAQPAAPDLARSFADGASGAGPGGALALVACEVEEPGNVGALARTALASGARLFLATGISDPFHPKAVRTSMGSLFRLDVAHRPSAAALVDELAGLGVRTVAAVSRGGTHFDALAARPRAAGEGLALFVGSEAFGLPAELLARMDERVSIPMASSVDSYSVNAAAAILCQALGPAG